MLQDDAVSQMRSLGNQLKEMEEDRDRTEARLQQLHKSLLEAEQGKLVSATQEVITGSNRLEKGN